MSTEQAALDRLAERALDRYGLDGDSTVRLLNVSENWTYRIDEPDGGRTFALRVHRPGYHTAEEIESELDWIDALRRDDVVETAHMRRLRRRQPRDAAGDARARRAQRRPLRVAHRRDAGARGQGSPARVPHPRRRLRRGCTATRRQWPRPSVVPALRLGLRHHARRVRALGTVAGRARHGPRGAGPARPPRRRRSTAGSRPTGVPRSGSAWCTPTSGWPTSWSTGPTCA